MNNLKRLIENGNTEEALKKVRRLAELGEWEGISKNIAYAFGLDSLFTSARYFTSFSREQQRTLIQALLPYALQALERGYSLGVEYLFATAIASGIPDLAIGLAEELAKRGEWSCLSGGIAKAFGSSSFHFDIWASLPWFLQEKSLLTMLPYSLQALKHGETLGVQYAIASGMTVEPPGRIEPPARKVIAELENIGAWESIASGIQAVLNGPVFNRFATLPLSRRRARL